MPVHYVGSVGRVWFVQVKLNERDFVRLCEGEEEARKVCERVEQIEELTERKLIMLEFRSY